jgi:hypothetical protein
MRDHSGARGARAACRAGGRRCAGAGDRWAGSRRRRRGRERAACYRSVAAAGPISSRRDDRRAPGKRQITTGIFCLESWSGNLAHRSTVRRLLELLEAQAGVKFIRRVVDGKDTFFDLLGRWPSHRGYRLGYIACHGEPETLRIGGDSVELAELTSKLGERGMTLRARRCASVAARCSQCLPRG